MNYKRKEKIEVWFGVTVILLLVTFMIGGLIMEGLAEKHGPEVWSHWASIVFFYAPVPVCLLYSIGQLVEYQKVLTKRGKWILLAINPVYIIFMVIRWFFLPDDKYTN